MENIPADRQLFQKLRIGHLCNIGIAVVLFVTGGVVIHRLFVAYSRAIAMKIYDRILQVRPSWTEKVAVVMTESNKDPEECVMS